MINEMTPEEKLLKLIRKDNSPDAGSKANQEDEKMSFHNIFRKVEPLRLLNTVLIFLSIGIGVYLFQNAVTDRPTLPRMPLKAAQQDMGNVKIPESVFSNLKPFAFYQEKISERNFFQYPWEKPKQDEGAVKNVTVDLQSQLKVVGILLDREPKVIIEDLRTQQTLFLSRGERIGDAVLETIEEGKAVFLYNGQRIELVP